VVLASVAVSCIPAAVGLRSGPRQVLLRLLLPLLLLLLLLLWMRMLPMPPAALVMVAVVAVPAGVFVAQQVFGVGVPIVPDNNGFKVEEHAVLQTGSSSALVFNIATRARAAAAAEATQRCSGVRIGMAMARRTMMTTSMPAGAAVFSDPSLARVAQEQTAAAAAVQSIMLRDSKVFKAKSMTVRPSGVAARREYREWRKARASQQLGGRSSGGLARRQHPEQIVS
jgi:hypothetical protein